MRKLTSLLLFSILSFASYAQDADALLSGIVLKMQKVKDYKVEALITSDIPMVKILPSKATIYFKQKDKIKIDAKGIAIVPKQGFNDISKLLADKNSYTAIYMMKETVNGIATELVSIFPKSDTSDLVLSKLWIDPVNDIVIKSQTTTRSSGTVTVEYKYGSQKSWGLPDQLIFTVDVKKFKIPKGVATDLNKKSDKKENEKEQKQGKITIDLTSYVINKGIKDEVFK
ncbi:MAG: hypothetical protein R2809_09340 [Flavobacteriales bacterium]